MSAEVVLFWILATVTVASALTTVMITSPVFSALSLAMTMIGISALFVTLGAYFLAGVQLIVYAGAVMVLFVMVLMLFDLRHEVYAFTQGAFSGLLKLLSLGVLGGFFLGAILWSGFEYLKLPDTALALEKEAGKSLGQLLFTRYVFGFEALGVLLLVVAVGAVALARSKGGTHGR